MQRAAPRLLREAGACWFSVKDGLDNNCDGQIDELDPRGLRGGLPSPFCYG